MHTRAVISVLAVLGCASPQATHAGDFAIAELGIHLAGLPAGVASPEVKARVDGYTATLRIGTATLRVDRMEETLPSGSDIRNASFRASQEAGFQSRPLANAKGEPTTINGHDAWTTTSGVRSPEGSVNYTSTTYVVVDQHLYRFLAVGWSKQEGPSRDFLAAMQALSNLTFEPVDRSSISAAESPSGLVKMPYFFPSGKEYYPDAARRRAATGVVDLEFSIDGKGRARDVKQVYAATHELEASALSVLTDARFQLSAGWEQKGYQKLRFTLEVHYSLAPRGGRCEELPTRVSDAQLVLICGSAL